MSAGLWQYKSGAPRSGGIPTWDHQNNPTTTAFKLSDLWQFKRGAPHPDPGESPDYRTFYVGRDDVHKVLIYLVSLATVSFRLNMFGYDDDDLDSLIKTKLEDQHVYVQGTLDRSQSAGKHERVILDKWDTAMRNSFAIGESATHQISHTKGGVIDGLIAFEGSTNWSASGEGVGIVLDPTKPQHPHFKAQNNTLLVHVNSIEVHEFSTELDEEHTTALQQSA